MTTKSTIKEFLDLKRLALVGVSRRKNKFGNTIYKELKAKAYDVVPVNPHMNEFEGEACYPNLNAIPAPVDGVVTVVPPRETEKVVKDAAEHKIAKVWMQQGSQSAAAVRFCEENGIGVVEGECILMFADPKAFHHRLHRLIWGLLGKLPR